MQSDASVGTSVIKCSRCPVKQRQEAFPRARSLKYLKTCSSCTLKLSYSRKKTRDEHTETSPGEGSSSSTSNIPRRGPKLPRAAELRAQLTWEEFLALVGSQKSIAFGLDAEIKLEDFPNCTESGVNDIGEIAKAIAKEVWKVTGYRFIYKKCEKSRSSDHIKTFVFCCAQFCGEKSKQKLNPDTKKRRARTTMDRFECNGYLRVTMIDKNTTLAGITITHHRSHCPYVVSVPDKVESIIQEMINMPASKSILEQKEEGELTEEQKSSSSLDEDMDEDDTPSSRTTDSSMVVRKEGGSRAERTVAELDNLVSADKSDCLNDEDPEETRCYFEESRREQLKRCFEDMLIASSSSTGLHPKMGSIFDHVFKQVEQVGSDIGNKRRRKP